MKFLTLIFSLLLYFTEIACCNEYQQKIQNFITCEEKTVMPTHEMRAETIYMTRCMEELHYNHKDIALLDHKEILIDYISELDVHRMILLQKEVDDFIKRFASTLDIFVTGGSLMPAFTIFDQYRKDAYIRLDWINERLQKDWDFSVDETYCPERKEAKWPDSQFEADMLWEKRLKYELLNEMMSSEYKLSNYKEISEEKLQTERDKEALVAAIKTISKRYENIKNALKDFDSWLVEEIFLNSIAHMYDPHSSFLSKPSLDDFNIMLRNSLVGIGAVLMDDNGTCVIKELYPGGPASLSKKLKVGDKILSVAQGEEGEFIDIVGMRLYKSVKLIRGKKDSVVRLKVQPVDASPGDYKIVSLIRDEIHVTETRASGKLFSFEVDESKVNIGVVLLPAFYGNDPNSEIQNADTTSDMKYLINAMKKKQMDGLIIDLRQNSGGFLDQAVTASGLFIVDGPVVQVRDSSGAIENLCDDDTSIEWGGPLITLISSNSASASEILVGALHDHRRAIIVGDPSTHGKGSVQAILPMNAFFHSFHEKDQLGAARVTVQKWYLPTGGSTQLKGVKADIALPSFEAYLPIKEYDLPHALSWDSIPAANFNYEEAAKKYHYFVDPEIISFLKQKVDDRLETLQELQDFNTLIAHFKQNIADQKEVSLNLKKRREKALSDLRFKADMKQKLEKILESDDFKFEKIHLPVAVESEANEIFDPNKSEVLPDIDIQLRECLRIMRDWITKEKEKKELGEIQSSNNE